MRYYRRTGGCGLLSRFIYCGRICTAGLLSESLAIYTAVTGAQDLWLQHGVMRVCKLGAITIVDALATILLPVELASWGPRRIALTIHRRETLSSNGGGLRRAFMTQWHLSEDREHGLHLRVRSPSCGFRSMAYARLPASLGRPLRRSHANCAGTLRHAAADWNIGPPPPNGMLIVRCAVRNQPSWLRMKSCAAMCKSGLQVRSPRPME